MLKRVAHAFLAFFFGQGIGVVASLLLVPLYLHVWSPALYGEWLALYSAVAYLSMLDMGVQTYAVNRMTQAYARGDLQEYRQIQHSAFALYSGVAAAGTAGVAILAFCAPIRSWFHLTTTDQRSVSIVVLLLGAQLLWTLPGSLVFHVYATTGNLPRSQWVANGLRISTLALTAAALVFWPKLPVLAAVQLGCFLAVFVFVLWDVRRRFPGLLPGWRCADFSLLGPVFKQSLLFALIDLAIGAALQGSNLIVAVVIGATGLALFATTRTLANSIRQLVGLFVNAASTDLTRMEALEDKSRLTLAFRLLVFTSVAISLAVSASLWFEGASVFSTWTHGRLLPDEFLLRTFLLWLVLQSPWVAASTIPLCTNKHRLVAICYVLSTIGGLSLGVVLMPRLGLAVLPAAFILSEGIACYHFVVHDACRIVGQNYRPFAARLWIGLAAIAATTIFVTWAVHSAGGFTNVSRWICSGVASTVTVALGTWLIWFGEEERLFMQNKTGLGLRLLERTLPLRFRPSNG